MSSFYVHVLSMKTDTERASGSLHIYMLTPSYILRLLQAVRKNDSNLSALCVGENQ